MFTSNLNDVKGKNYEVLGVVNAYCNTGVFDYYYSEKEKPKKIMDAVCEYVCKKAEQMNADGIIGITYFFPEKYYSVFACGTAIKFTEGNVDESNAERPKYYKK